MGRGVKAPSGEVINMKENFEVESKVEPFYTGGDLQLSVDGRLLFAACGSTVKVITTETGRTEHSISEEEDTVMCLTVSNDGSILVVGWRSVLIKQYSLVDEVKCVRTWKGHLGPTVSMAFDPSSTFVATGSTDSTVKVWDATKHYCTHNLKGSSGVVSLVQFHPDTNKLQLYTSSTDTSIRVWDLKTSRCVHVLRGHVSAVTSIAFAGDLLVSGGRDKVVQVWDIESGSIHKTLPVYESVEGVAVIPLDAISHLSPTPKSKKTKTKKSKKIQSIERGVVFATAGDKGVIRLWDMLNSDPIQTLQPLDQGVSDSPPDSSTPQAYTGLMYSESQGALVGVTYDHNVLFYSQQEEFQKSKQFIGYLDEVLDMRFAGESESLLAVATNSEQIKVFDRKTGSCQLLCGHSQVVLCLEVSTDGNTMVTSSKDKSVRVWKLDTTSGLFHCVALGTGHTHSVGAVTMSKVKCSFVVSGSKDSTIKLWSLKSLRGHDEGAGPVRLTVKYTQLAHDKDINSLDVSPNDKLLVSASQDKTAKLWQARDGLLLGTFRGHRRGVWSVRFSPVDQCVVTASGDATVKLWALSDFSCVKTFEGHTNSVLKAIFLSRGMQLSSSGSDGLVKVWTIRSNECAATLDQHTERIWALATTKDGDVLASGGGDSLVCYWKDVTERVENEQFAEREQQLLRQQELDNLMHRKDYVKAVGVAISLDQPFRLLNILKELLEEGSGSGSKFTNTILSLREDQNATILRYLTRWNQNAKHCHVAQSILSVMLQHLPTDTLLSMEDLGSHLKGLIPYTERHCQRLDRLQQLSTFVEYTWQRMTLPSLDPSTVPIGVEPVTMDTEHIRAITDSTTAGQSSDNSDDNVLESQDNHDDRADQVTSSGDAISPTQRKARSKISKKAKLKRLQERGSESKSPLTKGKKKRQKTKAQLTELIST